MLFHRLAKNALSATKIALSATLFSIKDEIWGKVVKKARFLRPKIFFLLPNFFSWISGGRRGGVGEGVLTLLSSGSACSSSSALCLRSVLAETMLLLHP